MKNKETTAEEMTERIRKLKDSPKGSPTMRLYCLNCEEPSDFKYRTSVGGNAFYDCQRCGNSRTMTDLLDMDWEYKRRSSVEGW